MNTSNTTFLRIIIIFFTCFILGLSLFTGNQLVAQNIQDKVSVKNTIDSTATTIIENSPLDTMRLSQEEVIEIARRQSLAAFKAKNMFISNYWSHRSFLAGKRPVLWLNATPINYDHSIIPQYDSQKTTYTYNPSSTTNSNGSISLNQSIPWTGGTIFMETELERNQDLLHKEKPVYVSNPIVSLGLNQSLSLYNPLKWQSKIQPLEFERKKKEYLQNVEQLSISAVNYFFSLASAQVDMSIANNNLENTTALFELGKERKASNDISQDEYLDLELNQLNADIAHSRALLDLQQAQQKLNSFLVLPKSTYIICKISQYMPITNIDFKVAYDEAIENNPTLMWYKQELISADQNVAYTKSNTGMAGTLSAKYGLTATSKNVRQAYTNPTSYRQIAITFSYPLVDWGQRKGQYLMAKSNKQVTQAEIDQAKIDFEQDLYMRVMKFNIQEKRVKNSSKADQIALEAFNATNDQFRDGKANVVKLNSSRSSREQAKRAYINSLKEYWIDYYSIRKICLYDFEKKISCNEDFNHIIDGK